LKANVSLILIPIEVQGVRVNARKILIDDSLPAIQGLPHGDVPLGMTSDHEVIYLAETQCWMVFVDVWYI